MKPDGKVSWNFRLDFKDAVILPTPIFSTAIRFWREPLQSSYCEGAPPPHSIEGAEFHTAQKADLWVQCRGRTIQGKGLIQIFQDCTILLLISNASQNISCITCLHQILRSCRYLPWSHTPCNYFPAIPKIQYL